MKNSRTQQATVVVVILLAGAWQACADEGDVGLLLEGVNRIGAPGVPGPLCVFGERAVAVVAGGASHAVRAPVVAAARMGAGRVVAFGHPGYFATEALAASDTGRLMANAIRWAGGQNKDPRVAVYRQKALADWLQTQGLKAEELAGPEWRGKEASFSVLCANPNDLASAPDLEAVTKFVSDGGGIVVADLGWGWLQLHPGKSLLVDHAGNRLLAPAGIVWADGYLSHTAEGGYAAKAAPPALCHAGKALDALLAHTDGKAKLEKADLAQAGWSVSQAATSLPANDKLLLPKLHRLRQERAAQAMPTPEKPLRADQALDRVLLTLDIEETKRLLPEKVRPHPAAAGFPGAVPAEADRVTRAVQIDTAVSAWHSTGLYAPPGEAVSVKVPEAAAGKKLQVRIGAHSDTLWGLDSWHRCPEICRQFPIDRPITRAANAFGGLVYIEVPERGKLGAISVEITGAIEAPHYVLGKTDLTQWRDRIRSRPAPWAELQTTKVVLTLPAKVVRSLDDPETLMKFWDSVLDACAGLAGRPLVRERPERYVADTQIGAGYMHAGYPIMTLTDIPEVMVDKARMMSNGHGGVWGLFHELGHNHQSGDWTFDGTGEVTENLFTLYVFEKACKNTANLHPGLSPEERTKSLKAYMATGPDFAKWKSDPFLALQMYVQLKDAFGWDAFKKVFAEYRGLPAGQHPRNDDEKRDQWMVRFSRAVGRNLGPFFQAWGVPTSEKARASIAELPAWMPDGFPPK